MPRSLKLYITSLVAFSALALVVTSFVYGVRPAIALELDGQTGASSPETALGLLFWTAVTALASALPVRMPKGMLVTVSIAPVLAATALGGPAAGVWIALVGSTELRELRGRVPWYGTLANHAGIVLPAAVGGVVIELIRGTSSWVLLDFIATILGAIAYFALNLFLVSIVLHLRTQQRLAELFMGDVRAFWGNLFALAPLGWLMARMYSLPGAGWWAMLLFAVPLYTTRVAYNRFVEMREMFTQTIGALAEAVDKRDPYTSKHSHNVKLIAVDIGREMRVSASELEALEWGGLLHDVGKIGVPDSVLLKSDRLTRDERMLMNAHPVLGAQIISPVTKLAPELPIIRHHHEWYNGSGYPDRLIGDEIPKLARILHVADAFEAMTAVRPYRLTPLSNEQALSELRKFAGIQFDPAVVDAFVKTDWVHGVSDAGRREEPRQIPLIAHAANRMTQATTVGSVASA
ncbi:MAG: HD-GYP domain-containing protein, partial [Chloroflexi bacterium]|nr:HD-GYP domain-containing protein [Chloroflexota bacterium]